MQTPNAGKMGATALLARLRTAGRDAEADVVAVVWMAIRTHPVGDNGLLAFTGSLAEASGRLAEYHRQQGLLDE